MLGGDVADELLDDDRLPGAGAAEDGGLATLEERADQVDDLHAGLEDLGSRRLVGEGRRCPVDRVASLALHGALAVDRLADDVEEPPERVLSDGHRDRAAGVGHLHAASQAVGGLHRDGAHPVVPEVLLHLRRDFLAALVLALHGEGVVDLGQLALLEAHVEDGTDDLDDLARPGRFLLLHGCLHCHLCYPFSASAPEAISSISLVIRVWRALFAASVRSPMMSSAASVALRIATICAENCEAFDSRIA